MASLRPRSIAGWVARDQARPGRPDAMVPRQPMRPGNWMPRCIAISTIKPDRGAWCQRASAPSDQDRRKTKATRPTSCYRQLGTSISSTTLVPCLDGTFVNSALPPHRPPWSLARIGPSLPPSPSSPSHQVGAGDMVPSRPARQGVRCISIARRPGRQADCSPLGCQGAFLIWGTSVPRPPWSPLHQGADGSEGPSRRWRIGRLDPSRDKRSRGLDGLGSSAIEAQAAPRSHAPSFTLVPRSA